MVSALRERAELHQHSMQQELRQILEEAAAMPLPGQVPDPVELITTRSTGASTWRRDEVYGDEGR